MGKQTEQVIAWALRCFSLCFFDPIPRAGTSGALREASFLSSTRRLVICGLDDNIHGFEMAASPISITLAKGRFIRCRFLSVCYLPADTDLSWCQWIIAHLPLSMLSMLPWSPPGTPTIIGHLVLCIQHGRALLRLALVAEPATINLASASLVWRRRSKRSMPSTDTPYVTLPTP